MSEKIVQLNEEVIKGQIKELVRGSVEETLNELLEQEAEKLTQAARYERSEARQGYRSGHYDRNLTMVGFIVGRVEKRCDALGRAVSVEEIQDMIVDELDQSEHYRLARRYSSKALYHQCTCGR